MCKCVCVCATVTCSVMKGYDRSVQCSAERGQSTLAVFIVSHEGEE